MAIYHLSAKIISRKAGRSSTAAAAYRAGVEIVDERTGEIYDYRRKGGVEHAEIVIPSASDWEPTRAELWNVAELKNKRQDAQVAREFIVALPDELDPAGRQRLAVDFARASNQTLVGFLRGASFNIYTHPQRISHV
jgi:propanediol dehydratase small subunit